MKRMSTLLVFTFIISLLSFSCTEKKKEDNKAIEKIEVVEKETEKETKELEKEAEELEKSLEELDNL